MSMERLIELKNIFKDNADLMEKTSLELAVLATLIDNDETPVKNFIAETAYHDYEWFTQGELITGELMLTDKRILFITKRNGKGQVFEIKYEEIDGFYTGVDETDKMKGIITVLSEGSYYVFSGLMRFGLTRWEEYVNGKMKLLKNNV